MVEKINNDNSSILLMLEFEKYIHNIEKQLSKLKCKIKNLQ